MILSTCPDRFCRCPLVNQDKKKVLGLNSAVLVNLSTCPGKKGSYYLGEKKTKYFFFQKPILKWTSGQIEIKK